MFLDSGIISPARGVIAGSLNISESAGIWMVTIYTLTYAVSMPITGRLADSLGRKKIYIACIIIFTIGSLLCWLSDVFNNYNFLLISRVIQALGGGGIMPIATAYIACIFPSRKKRICSWICRFYIRNSNCYWPYFRYCYSFASWK